MLAPFTPSDICYDFLLNTWPVKPWCYLFTSFVDAQMATCVSCCILHIFSLYTSMWLISNMKYCLCLSVTTSTLPPIEWNPHHCINHTRNWTWYWIFYWESNFYVLYFGTILGTRLGTRFFYWESISMYCTWYCTKNWTIPKSNQFVTLVFRFGVILITEIFTILFGNLHLNLVQLTIQ